MYIWNGVVYFVFNTSGLYIRHCFWGQFKVMPIFNLLILSKKYALEKVELFFCTYESLNDTDRLFVRMNQLLSAKSNHTNTFLGFCSQFFRKAGPPQRVDCLAPDGKYMSSVFPKGTIAHYQLGNRTGSR